MPLYVLKNPQAEIKKVYKNAPKGTKESEEYEDYLNQLNLQLIKDYLRFRFGRKVSNKFMRVTNQICSNVTNQRGQRLDLKHHILITLKLLEKGCE